jgi:hypothetical protein
LTLEKEDGVVSLFNDQRINTLLKKRQRMLKYSPYPIMVFIEKYSTGFFHKVGLKKRQTISI